MNIKDMGLSPLRVERNETLASTDWLVQRHKDEAELGIATTLTIAQYVALQEYRKALRDFPKTADPDKPVWPTPPEFMK